MANPLSQTKETSVGPMKELHVQLYFDRKTNALLKQKWRDAQAQDRVAYAGMGLAGVLLVLLLAYGVLKIDLATKGAYRRHMLIGTGIVALGFLLSGLLLTVGQCDLWETVALTGGFLLAVALGLKYRFSAGS